jgi:hypothetical protein
MRYKEKIALHPMSSYHKIKFTSANIIRRAVRIETYRLNPIQIFFNRSRKP